MADIELVIKIPEEIRLALINNIQLSLDQQSFMDSCIKQAIINGVKLPKGHGKLIDADRIITEATERMKYPANHKYMECVIAHMKLAQTIIEADKESEDKE